LGAIDGPLPDGMNAQGQYMQMGANGMMMAGVPPMVPPGQHPGAMQHSQHQHQHMGQGIPGVTYVYV